LLEVIVLFSTKGGSINRQGQGWAYDFTIDSGYKADVLQVSFQYLVNSGTFNASSGIGSSATLSDVTAWLYDVTNAVVIQSLLLHYFLITPQLLIRLMLHFKQLAIQQAID
jgi:hypothetical protein